MGVDIARLPENTPGLNDSQLSELLFDLRLTSHSLTDVRVLVDYAHDLGYRRAEDDHRSEWGLDSEEDEEEPEIKEKPRPVWQEGVVILDGHQS